MNFNHSRRFANLPKQRLQTSRLARTYAVGFERSALEFSRYSKHSLDVYIRMYLKQHYETAANLELMILNQEIKLMITSEFAPANCSFSWRGAERVAGWGELRKFPHFQTGRTIFQYPPSIRYVVDLQDKSFCLLFCKSATYPIDKECWKHSQNR